MTAVPLPVVPRAHAPPQPLLAPTSLRCLRCQLLHRGNLLCAKKDTCRSLPRVQALGPILLAGWLATALAFIVTAWR